MTTPAQPARIRLYYRDTVRLTRLHIKQFRDVHPPVELHFHHGHNLIVGGASSGKTTLLDLIASIIADNLWRYVAEPFAITYELTLSSGIRVTVDLDYAPTQWIQDADLTDMPSWTRDMLGGIARRANSTITVQQGDERIAIYSDGGEANMDKPDGTEVQLTDAPFLCHNGFVASNLLLACQAHNTQSCDIAFGNIASAHMNQRPPRYDKALACFSRSLGFRPHDAEASNVLVLHTYNDEGKLVCGHCQLLPLEVSHLADFTPYRQDGCLRLPHKHLPFLAWAVEQLGLSRGWLELVLQKTIGDEHNDSVTYIYNRARYLLDNAAGERIGQRALSNGERRLLGFAWWQAIAPLAPFVADELANGMKDEWVEACVALLDGRQTFLGVRGDGDRQWWEQMAEGRAGEVFVGLEGGISIL